MEFPNTLQCILIAFEQVKCFKVPAREAGSTWGHDLSISSRTLFSLGICWEEKENPGPESDCGIPSALASTEDHFLKSECSYFPGQTLPSLSQSELCLLSVQAMVG